jgi:hypothetical protein
VLRVMLRCSATVARWYETAIYANLCHTFNEYLVSKSRTVVCIPNRGCQVGWADISTYGSLSILYGIMYPKLLIQIKLGYEDGMSLSSLAAINRCREER